MKKRRAHKKYERKLLKTGHEQINEKHTKHDEHLQTQPITDSPQPSQSMASVPRKRIKADKSGDSKKPENVISSLFKYNPKIPKVSSSKVSSITEDVFSSDSFKALSLHPYMLKTLEEQLHLETMTEVQRLTIPTVLQGHDVLVKSQTGSGKTLAFAVPIVEILQSLEPPVTRSDGPYAIVIVPTRELAQQCLKVFSQLVKPFIRIVPGCIIGGEKRKAEKSSIRKGLNILVCTPGRLVDHLENTASLTLDKVRFLVLDEADRLCDLGYEKNIAQVVTALNTRSRTQCQTALLSATLTDGVERLAGLAMNNPKHITLSEQGSQDSSTTAKAEEKSDTVPANFTVPVNLKQYFVITPCKLRLVTLAAFILWKCKLGSHSKMLVFMSTQDSVEFHHQLFTQTLPKLDQSPDSSLTISHLHGNMEQKERTEVFQKFSKSQHGVLLCTDVAARGLDLAHVQWIVQYNVPSQEADYVHRVGRTARAGARGQSLLFLLPSEVDYIHVLNKQNISLEEMNMKKILSCLVPVVAEMDQHQDSETNGTQRPKPRDLVESATFLQMRFESTTQGSENLLNVGRQGFQSYVRFYGSYPRHLKSIFEVRNLHLGHAAKTFGLREAPAGIGERAGKPAQKRKQKHGDLRSSAVKIQKREISEFDSGLSPSSHSTSGPKPKKTKHKKKKLK